ncbi:PhoH family protein [Anaeromyxobacter sp. Fw109-5]|uniref:PhoH family protein n=1 Tax=Anaeromyxobacter sp. (strain Fw109-5) TaxID=404589 RepID=UPI0000ED74C8|nr:PhoH family protein [Anaeromyxobacter sp. Fw109-5]ABS26441.1 PhoH family protein [Anaeromyxobacter sp. Fw109-5]
MKKNFVLDTNVLLHDPRSIFGFGDNDVIIPIYVIEEIDNFKRDLSTLGRNARQVSRYLDEFRVQGKLRDGVPIGEGKGRIRVLVAERKLPPTVAVDGHSVDDKILAVALELLDRDRGFPTVFVTKDTNLRIRADALGLHAEDYDVEGVELDELWSGVDELEVSPDAVNEFYANGSLPWQAEADPPPPNEFVVLRDRANPQHSAVGKYSAPRQAFVQLIKTPKEGVWGIRPRNKEQSFALDLLLNDDIRLVTIVGKAGTGKTLLAIAAGLQKTMEEGVYQKLLVSRPIFPLGRDIGYLPGSVEEKLNPWMQPIFDNVEYLMNLSRSEKKAGRGYHELLDLGILEIEPLTYIRGRSIPNQFIIVDEAQNLTPHEVKTIITRVGDGTKIVLTGDPYQIDNPYVDQTNNGLIHVVNRFKSERLAGHITMSKGERSPLAELAANLL